MKTRILFFILALIAFTDAGAQLRARWGGTQQLGILPGAVKYPATLGVARNTASAVAVLSAALKRNVWANHETITIDFWALTKHDSSNATISLVFGTDTLVLANAFQGSVDSTVSRYRLEMRRIGTSVYIFNGNAANTHNSRHIFDALNNDADVQDPYNDDPADGGGGIFTNVGFTVPKQLKIIVDFVTPSVNDVFSVISANIIKN